MNLILRTGKKMNYFTMITDVIKWHQTLVNKYKQHHDHLYFPSIQDQTPTPLFLGLFFFDSEWLQISQIHNLHFNKLHRHADLDRQTSGFSCLFGNGSAITIETRMKIKSKGKKRTKHGILLRVLLGI